MRRLINYIRSCFCKHEFELLSHDIADEPAYSWKTRANKWTYICKKCGYIKTHTDSNCNN